MKRHKSLIPLSHDHHHGLILVRLIRKDTPTLPEQPQSDMDKLNHTLKAWETELKPHFENEEKILFPFVRGFNGELDNLIDEILDEHRTIENMVKKLHQSGNLKDDLHELGVTLENHIRKEERQLFQLIQTTSGVDLDNLADKINAVKDQCDIG